MKTIATFFATAAAAIVLTASAQAQVTLKASHFNCYVNPMNKANTCGGDFAAEITRSQFGVNYGLDWGFPDAMRLVIACDRDAARARRIASRFGCRAEHDWRAAVAHRGVAVVNVATGASFVPVTVIVTVWMPLTAPSLSVAVYVNSTVPALVRCGVPARPGPSVMLGVGAVRSM